MLIKIKMIKIGNVAKTLSAVKETKEETGQIECRLVV